ncbi:MAG: thioredoxin domain-containing protein [Candidatus Paceibacterota bacterium]|jgi:protein-disulfide isomerase
MNIKRITFWAGFIIVIGLIIWGLIVAMNKPTGPLVPRGTPAPITAEDHITSILPSSDVTPVTLIEYSDFQCPACGAYHILVEQLLASSTIPIKFVYRHFPLTQHLNAIPAAMASEAAGVQGKFWDMYHLIFEDTSEWTELSDPTSVFIGYATKIGLDLNKFKTDLTSSTLKTHINNDLKEGVRVGINATPTFFVNGKAIVNPTSYEAFKTLIETASSESTK